MTTLADSSTELHASQATLAHSVTTVNSTVNTLTVRMDKQFGILMDFLSASKSHKKQRTTAPATPGTQDTSTPGTQERHTITDLCQTRESDVNMAEAAE